jgi:peptidoglycan/xylan/chitin deacetylase (PgdA/CDA1 family)
VRPAITSASLRERFGKVTGREASEFAFATQIYGFETRHGDEVLVDDVMSGLPLIVRRQDEVIVNFDIKAAQAFQFVDSKRPVYTYIPGFNIQSVPEGPRRAVSNFLQGLYTREKGDVVASYRSLPLTTFEFVVLLLQTIVTDGREVDVSPFRWPSGKRAAFVALHDIDTGGMLRRQEKDPLFLVEAKHQVQSTWFLPSALLGRNEGAVDFLLKAGHEVGWHGHKHDHRDHVGRFAEAAVDALSRSRLNTEANFPTGMRAPRLLKSQHMFATLERSCRRLRYDTSFLNGIVPYPLWLYGQRSRIFEIPTTVPTDIRLYNQLAGVARARRPEMMLKAQIARTEKLIEAGGLISIVTHPERALSERPDFLEVYDRYLAFIKNRSDVWFTTAGEIFKYWTGLNADAASAGPIPSTEGKAS